MDREGADGTPTSAASLAQEQQQPRRSNSGSAGLPVLPPRPSAGAKSKQAAAGGPQPSPPNADPAPSGNGTQHPPAQQQGAATGASTPASAPAKPPVGLGNIKRPFGSTSFMPTLPPRTVPPAAGPVLDPDEPEATQQVRVRIHAVRVSLVRAAQRLGYDADNALVRQVLYRLALAEKLKAPWRRAARRPDPNLAAAREAAMLEAQEAAAAASAAAGAGQQPATPPASAGGGSGAVRPLGFCVRMMLVGLAGVGKTQLIHALLGSPPPGNGSLAAAASNGGGGAGGWPVVDPIRGATKGCTVHKGSACGIPLEVLDTPGLLAAAAGTVHNSHVLQQIQRAYRSFKPDLVVYVDRLDAGGAARWGGELPALRGLSQALGPATWLNTIVALTHAGSTPPASGPRGTRLSWDQWVQQRSHVLQQAIRAASGDNRLMNPTAFVESHPTARRDASGTPLLYNGLAWRPHLLLMVVSAKLLSDTENMLQMQDGEGGQGQAAGAGASAAAQQLLISQMMGGSGRTLPLPYLTTQATQFSQPLKYPDHDQVMAVRRAESAAQAAHDPRQRKALTRQAKALRLQVKQALQYREKMARSFRMATLAGSKVTPAPPPLASKRPPSVHPPCSFRYRVPEPSGGWVVRPCMEPHGMDVSDGIDGLQMELFGVVGRGAKPPRPAHAPPQHAKPPPQAHAHQPQQQQAQPQQQQPSAAESSKAAAPGPAPQGKPAPASDPPPPPPTTPSTSAQPPAAALPSASQPQQQQTGQPPPGGSAATATAPPPAPPQPQAQRRAEDEAEWRDSAEAVALNGTPVHHFVSAQAGKASVVLQGRSEATVYHDPLGSTTTALSADVQASSTGGAPLDALVVLRADLRRKALPLLPGGSSNRTTAGLMLTRLAEGGRLHQGPLAFGARLQNTFRSTLGGRRAHLRRGGSMQQDAGGMPVDVAAAAALMYAPTGCTSHATAASLAAVGGGAPPTMDPELCVGGNMEVTADLQGPLRTRRPVPLTVNANMLRYKGDLMTTLATSVQVRGRRRDACAVRAQVSNRGKAGVSLKVHSGPWWWMGLVAMAVPLVNLARELVSSGSR